MRKKLYLLIVSGLFTTLTSWAQLPFETTTVVDGAFAEDTPWYVIRIGSNGSIISDNEGADYITVGTSVTSYEDADLWCFTGNDADGYRLYNKQAGAGMVLASSTVMTGINGYSGTGGSTYPILYGVDAIPDGYVDTWDFSISTSIADVDGLYMKIHNTDYAVNNFGGIGKLAFWAEGADVGSTIVLEAVNTNVDIRASTGEFTASNSGGTWHSKWESNQVDGFSLAVSANNLTTSNDCIVGFSGLANSSTYTLTAPEGYCVYGYRFDAVDYSGSSTETITVEGTQYSIGSTSQHVAVSGLEERIATFTQTGSNKGVLFSNFSVTLRPSTIEPEPSFEVFPTLTTADIPYRIPAIAKAYNGDIIAVADYRHSRADIGMASYGRIDLHARISKDNGVTWGDIFPIVEGKGAQSPDFMNVGFGDPCIVADRESSRVMVLSCAGNVSFPNGTRNNHQNIARFYSDDNGATWEAPVDIADTIYAMFDNSTTHGPVRAMFIGSGKIIQSETVKAGSHYRIYCAVLLKNVNSVNTNFVLYSDDFGGTWSVLGGVENAPIPSGADEPKVEELPDGSILVSSRCTGGRYYNIYSFTDSEKAEGSWGTMCFSGESTNGVTALSNSCNGEVMLVPVTRNADGKAMYLFLQSVPFGSGRTNVGIYYKEFENLYDFVSPDSVAWNWDGDHQSSYLSSAYSTMCMQADNTIGFLYEEDTYGTSGGGYTIVYKNYSIEYITDSLYSYNAAVDRNTVVAEAIEAKTAALDFDGGNYVGCVLPKAEDAVNAAVDAYKAAPSREAYEALNAILADLPQIKVEPNAWYRLRNTSRGNAQLYMKPAASAVTAGTGSLASADQLFSFVPATNEGEYYLYNGNYNYYLGSLGATETQPSVVTTTASAGLYTIESTNTGKSALVCVNKTGTHPAIHLAGDNSRLVPWTSTAEASLWYIEPVESYSVTIDQYGYLVANFPFDYQLPEGLKAYTAGGVITVDNVECVSIMEYDGATVYANTPVLLAGDAGTYDLTVAANSGEEYTGHNEFKGTLKAASVSGADVFTYNGGQLKKRSSSSGTIQANKAYYTSDSAASALLFSDQTTTAIETVTTDADGDGKFYDLGGRRVENPSRGIYIVNGRKVLVK